MLEKSFCFCFIGFAPTLLFSFSSSVAVSVPNISVVDKVVLEEPFKILCKSDNGSLPINYTLLKDKSQLSTISVKLPIQQALFTVSVTHTDEISKYTCEAKNSHKEVKLSKSLNATVIGKYSNLITMFLICLINTGQYIQISQWVTACNFAQ